MKQVCAISGVPFEIDERDLKAYAELSPYIGGAKEQLPLPTLCPKERQRRRLAFRNERYLYRTRCAVKDTPIISAYSPDKPLKVCGRESWLEIDNTRFGRPIDFSRPFFEQFAELQLETYKAAVSHAGEMWNSDFTHSAGWLKNCYLLFDSGKSEDCMYGVFCGYCRNCLDCMFTQNCELCYEGYKLEDCYGLFYCSYCKNCNSSACLHDCIGCTSCLCCSGLRNKSFYFENTCVGEARFKELWNYYICGSHKRREELESLYRRHLDTAPHRALRNIDCTNCRGDDLTSCENVLDSYNCIEAKDCRYCYDLYFKANDCYDVGSFGEGMQFCYEVAISGGTLGKSDVSNLYFSNYIYYGGYNIYYSSHCHENCQDLFGCSELRTKRFCILNKQYSEAEYFALVHKLIAHMRDTGEWGEHFPMSISPFGYNESLAQEFYPLTREQAQAVGAQWSNYSAPPPETSGSISAQSVPDSSFEAADEIVSTTVICSASGKPFKINSQELKFYREQGIPLPRYHHEERHRRRIRHFNPRALWERRCEGCQSLMLTSFAPERKEKVLCEKCYGETLQ